MSKQTETGSPRRAVIADPEPEVEISHTPSRTARFRLGSPRQAIAAGLALLLTAGIVLGCILHNNGTARDSSSHTEGAEAAVPQAALDSAAQGFADRSQAASRNQIRSGLSAAAAESAKTEREAAIAAAAGGTRDSLTEMSASQRDAELEADLELVNQQAAKLKQEAEAARRRLEAAAAAAAANLGDKARTISKQDLLAATSKGASMPLKSNFRMGSGFGASGRMWSNHRGQDMPAPTGTPVYAVASGIVLSPLNASWPGIHVIIQHGGASGTTLYGHMSRRVVQPGQAVVAGQLIGYVGSTGRSTGPHLHLEYYPHGVTPGNSRQATNPMAFLRSLGVKTP